MLKRLALLLALAGGLISHAYGQGTYPGNPPDTDVCIGQATGPCQWKGFSGDVGLADTGATTIQPGVVTGAKIASGTVTGSNIASGTVTNSNLATATQNTVKGAASSTAETDLAVPSCSTASSALTWTTNTGFGCNSITGGSGSGTLVSVVTYSSSQTITIPATATKAFIRMTGGTGGSGGTGAGCGTTGCSTGASGAPGYLEKYLTGLTAGNTLVFTQGAAGTAGANTGTAGGNGTASTLASGTQTITTLTANGSNGSAGTNVDATQTAATVGGTATNGDLNVTGVGSTDPFSFLGSNFFTAGAFGLVFKTGARTGNAGNAGQMVIMWFTWNLTPANDNEPLRLVG